MLYHETIIDNRPPLDSYDIGRHPDLKQCQASWFDGFNLNSITVFHLTPGLPNSTTSKVLDYAICAPVCCHSEFESSHCNYLSTDEQLIFHEAL